eukprot:scaffold27435_cov31-Prasinocladus_malaysianus.AAC.2
MPHRSFGRATATAFRRCRQHGIPSDGEEDPPHDAWCFAYEMGDDAEERALQLVGSSQRRPRQPTQLREPRVRGVVLSQVIVRL